MTLTVTSSAFAAGSVIPKPYTGDGKDVSPPLQWTAGPSGTQSYAVICEDPDAPRGLWVHWVLYNLPEAATALPEGLPKTATLADGSVQGKNDWGKLGYGGPAPPRG